MLRTEVLSSQLICDTKIGFGNSEEAGIFALAAAVNEVAAKGAAPLGVEIKLLLPESDSKSRLIGLKKRMKRAAEEAGLANVRIEGSFSPAVQYPMAVVSACGMAKQESPLVSGTGARAGQDVVMAGWLGLAGTILILEEREEELARRFTRTFLNQIKSYSFRILAAGEMQAAGKAGAQIVIQAYEGGILAALHYLALEAGTGFSVDMKKMPVRQETVEVCEHFRLNPYQLMSAGCFLMTSDTGEALVQELRRAGMEAVIIGRLTDNNDKIITNGEEIRYVDRPAPDELMKIL